MLLRIGYASPIPLVRTHLWKYLVEHKERVSSLWLLMGDFNDILSPFELNGSDFLFHRSKLLSKMVT